MKMARRQKQEKIKLSEIFGQKFSKLLHMKRADGNETSSKTLNMPEIKLESSNTSASPDLNSPIRSDVFSSGEGSRFNRLTSKVQLRYLFMFILRNWHIMVLFPKHKLLKAGPQKIGEISCEMPVTYLHTDAEV